MEIRRNLRRCHNSSAAAPPFHSAVRRHPLSRNPFSRCHLHPLPAPDAALGRLNTSVVAAVVGNTYSSEPRVSNPEAPDEVYKSLDIVGEGENWWETVKLHKLIWLIMIFNSIAKGRHKKLAFLVTTEN
ncbi:hypothetical protein L1987_33012 [Smallanthus sonchifolius]|uniref:Uncharacterized protein n=1 Tax=Smallanthus sonchifolius TaxID=185202 RepID=A0ACB9HPU0_9ASTR|nr:hypothetical protein L1987_33012 [Smallanthus sonchifolius]